ncbi:MAG: terminase small subunit [Epulopiscium sp.]|nr:terminase small subunit [Candidatus Epulonipiscium sp.]
MTPKQQKFADEYLIDLNATRAYKVAYPNVKKEESAAVNASKLLRNTKVAKYIKEKMQKRAKRTEVTQDRVVSELAKIGFAHITDFVEIDSRNNVIIKSTDEINKEKIGAIAGIKEGQNGIEVKLNDKVKALELLGRHLGMFTDKVQLDGPAVVQILDDIPKGDRDG